MRRKLAVFAVTIASAGATYATDGDIAAGLHLGTTGYGINAAYRLNDKVNLRGLYNHLNYDVDTNIDDFRYDLGLKNASFEVLLDWHVFGGDFRVSAGMAESSIAFSGRATPRETFVEFGNQTFRSADIERIDANVDFDRFVPYLGIGRGNSLAGGTWSFVGDVGVLFQGSPNSRVSATASDSAAPGVQAMLNQQAQAEANRLSEEIENFRFYPVIRFALMYRF